MVTSVDFFSCKCSLLYDSDFDKFRRESFCAVKPGVRTIAGAYKLFQTRVHHARPGMG